VSGQRAEGREQRAESREQRAESREQFVRDFTPMFCPGEMEKEVRFFNFR